MLDRPVSEAGQELDRACPKCGGKLAVKASRWGTKFIGCTSYPKCDYTSELQTECPKCGTELVKKRLANRRVILVCKTQRRQQRRGLRLRAVGQAAAGTLRECDWFLAESKVRGSDTWRRYCSNPECTNHRGLAGEIEEEAAPNAAAATTPTTE